MARLAAAALMVAACRGDPDPCAIGARVDSVDDALAAVDSLALPVTLNCFLTALERPLGVELTSDVFSTQPADGFRSPRILIRGPSLTLTVVPVGVGERLVELGEADPSGNTIKAELEFPIEAPLAPDAPYLRTLAAPGASETGCHTCHFDEIALGDGRYANTPLRPPDDLIVPLESLLDEHAGCDRREDPERCAMFSALLDHGDVVESRFPDDVATQFGPAP